VGRRPIMLYIIKFNQGDKMRKIILGVLTTTILFAITPAKEKFFVVERESESVAVVVDGLTKSHMKNMHNMNH